MEKLTALFKNHGIKKHSSVTEVNDECGNEYTVYGDISNIQRELEEAEKIVENLRLEKDRLEKGLESATEKRFVRIKFYGSSRNCYRFDLEVDTGLNVKQLILIVNTVHMVRKLLTISNEINTTRQPEDHEQFTSSNTKIKK